jgi:hypothetical protein
LKNDGTLLPKDIWVSPPLEAIKGTESKLIWLITRGQFLPKHNIQRPGGHSEMLIYNQDGELDALSCYMAEGVVKNTAEDIIAHLKEVNEAYYVLLPKKDISPEQASKAQSIFAQMLAEDIAWKDATNARTARIVDSLPIPGEWKEWLKKKFYCTGYGWLGFFIGPGGGIIGRLRTILRWLGFKGLLPDGHEPRMWTCISFCVEFAHRLGLELEEYGHSMLLIGLLDPVMPDDPLADKNFYYLSKPIEQ